MKILLVEPWLTGSHLSWAEGYKASSAHDVGIVGLPGELWRWRLRGGALPLAEKITTWIDMYGAPDLLLISGLVDVAELLGLARRNLPASVAVVIYQHESQLVYPVADGNYDNGAALRNWMSWCAADLVLFNSYYHMRAVAEALPAFVASHPDDTHVPMLDPVIGRFEVFPVGVDLDRIPELEPFPRSDGAGSEPGQVQIVEKNGSAPIEAQPPTILWPHRWERDKDPAAFVAALKKVEEAGLDFRLVLAGQDPPSGSASAVAERAEAEDRFADKIVASGDFCRRDYLDLIQRCDIVVSCARHEFFGVAVVEAVAAGCMPLLPNALSYPEIIRPPWHRSVLYQPGTFGTRLVEAVAHIDELKPEMTGLAQSMRRFDWSNLASTYDRRLDCVLSRLNGSALAS